MLRFFVIAFSVIGLLTHVLRARFSRAARASLPGHVRKTFEHLGPAFVKLGQALSMRPELLPDDMTQALQHLQDEVAGFSGIEARQEITRELRGPLERVFSAFDETPFAAASIAQVHRARLLDGREVIVKVRRPGIRAQIDRDMRLLVFVLHGLTVVIPALRRYEAISLAREIWARLQLETDLRREAANIRRFVEGFRDQPWVLVPDVEEALCGETILVQAFSHGHRIDDPRVRNDGPRLARVLVDAYLHQFFVMGLFHGDPHPGNVFVLDDGRLCFHDFGIVGQLSIGMRQRLATFMLALAHQNEQWLLDAATDLGLLSLTMDRDSARAGVGTILAEYAGAPLGESSLAQVLIRLIRLGHGSGLSLPANVAVLARAALLIEHLLRGLDRNLTVVDAIARADPAQLRILYASKADQSGWIRLKSEAATAAHELPALVAEWLHRAQREGGRIPVSLRVEAMQATGRGVIRSTNRLSLALVTLGLYIAASLLMQHSVGPRIAGNMPLFAAIGYTLALWFTWRIVSGIADTETGRDGLN